METRRNKAGVKFLTHQVELTLFPGAASPPTSTHHQLKLHRHPNESGLSLKIFFLHLCLHTSTYECTCEGRGSTLCSHWKYFLDDLQFISGAQLRQNLFDLKASVKKKKTGKSVVFERRRRQRNASTKQSQSHAFPLCSPCLLKQSKNAQ